jgi:hypothetical protein
VLKTAQENNDNYEQRETCLSQALGLLSAYFQQKKMKRNPKQLALMAANV